jgi:hypothetical protein
VARFGDRGKNSESDDYAEKQWGLLTPHLAAKNK